MKSTKRKIIIFIYFMACLIYCIWLPTYIKATTPKLTFWEYLEIQGISVDKFKSTMETLNKHDYRRGGGLLQQDAQRLLGKDLGNKVEYDNGQLVIKFNGNYITMDEIRGTASTEPIKGKSGMLYYHKYDEEELKKLY